MEKLSRYFSIIDGEAERKLWFNKDEEGRGFHIDVEELSTPQLIDSQQLGELGSLLICMSATSQGFDTDSVVELLDGYKVDKETITYMTLLVGRLHNDLIHYADNKVNERRSHES